ncbi:unnamed protein product [Rotaria sp. Silwood2]|nr:unnamed protein product [Rotaria sp. Silwood2]CAF4041684.1 unnamed protein product [Rotaria sp. Silwood2]
MLQDLTKIGIDKRNCAKIFVLPTTFILKGDNNKANRSLSSSSSSSSSLNSIEDKNNMIDNKSSPINEEGNINEVNGSPSNSLALSYKIR